jgi:hypothetical protein
MRLSKTRYEKIRFGEESDFLLMVAKSPNGIVGLMKINGSERSTAREDRLHLPAPDFSRTPDFRGEKDTLLCRGGRQCRVTRTENAYAGVSFRNQILQHPRAAAITAQWVCIFRFK